jgi:hypothetical protein
MGLTTETLMSMIKKAIIAVSLSVLSAHAAEIVQHVPFPERGTVTYNENSGTILPWFFARWEADGYAVPQDGETFQWSQYVRNIADFSELQPDDGVRYQDKLKHLVYALVVFIDNGTVEVEEPVPGGLVLMQAIDKTQIQTAFRPVHKLTDKTS